MTNGSSPANQVEITLPNWSDQTAVTTYVTSIVSAIFAIIGALHPGFKEPAVVQAIIPSVCVLVAAGAQIANVVTHRGVHKAAIAASGPTTSVKLMPTKA
jgi:hypothetical protein